MKGSKISPITIIIIMFLLVIGVGALYVIIREAREGEMESATVNNIEDVGEVYDYTIAMDNYSFSPELIQASPGEVLSIELVDVQGNHDFVIDEFGVRSELMDEGETQVIYVEIPEDAESGNYDFYCSIGNHRVLGMEGILQII